jgi:hypothetical protein
MSDLAKLEKRYEDVKVSPSFKGETHGLSSLAGDKALEFIDKNFTVLEDYLKIVLKDGLVKTLILRQLPYFYLLLRSAVEKALS